MKFFFLFGLISLGMAGQALAEKPAKIKVREFKTYQIDFAPLKKEAKAYEKYQALLAESRQKATGRANYKQRLQILETSLAKEPQWIDGYWLAGLEAFQLGSSYNDPKDHRTALGFFEKGESWSRRCLERKPDQVFCKMFVASNLAGASAIRGIVASLRHTSEIHRLWHDVAASEWNLEFTPEVSLQGSVHYALGLFYRLVPDSRFMQWFFGARGSLDRSIEFHQLNLAIDGPTPCGHLMLAASYLCAASKSREVPKEANPEHLLVQGANYEGYDINQAICQDFSKKLRAEPALACGMTTAKQHEDLDQG